jgi:endonuclease/exonuclease/phosphatase family metal-dependent hydrolase
MIYLTGKQISIAGKEHQWPNGLVDTFQTLHRNETKRRTLHFWSDLRDGALKVDHILVSRGAKIDAAEIISGDKPMVSDHFPVGAHVKFPP